jgi:hypothetical protein
MNRATVPCGGSIYIVAYLRLEECEGFRLLGDSNLKMRRRGE